MSEFVGTTLLLAAIVGSGIMGERLAAGQVAIALLANSLATGAALVALILTFGPISGAHFNPLVTMGSAWRGGLPWRDVPIMTVAQLAGGIAGVVLANEMYGAPALTFSHHAARAGGAQWLSEVVATFGLLAVVVGTSRRPDTAAAQAVAAYIVAAYWFTASTSFANPVVTIARSLTDTFTGIRPVDVPGFVTAQVIGAALAIALFSRLMPPAAAGSRHRARSSNVLTQTSVTESAS